MSLSKRTTDYKPTRESSHFVGVSKPFIIDEKGNKVYTYINPMAGEFVTDTFESNDNNQDK